MAKHNPCTLVNYSLRVSTKYRLNNFHSPQLGLLVKSFTPKRDSFWKHFFRRLPLSCLNMCINKALAMKGRESIDWPLSDGEKRKSEEQNVAT